MASLDRTIVGYGVLILCLGCAIGCGGKSTSERVAENLMEKAMKHGGVKDADVDLKKGTFSYKTDEGEGQISFEESEWPGDLPEGVPRFSMCTVKGVTRSERDGKKGWNSNKSCKKTSTPNMLTRTA